MGCGHIGEGAGLVKLELHLDGEKWFSQGGRKGEMVVGPTCAICILLCMNSMCQCPLYAFSKAVYNNDITVKEAEPFTIVFVTIGMLLKYFE